MKQTPSDLTLTLERVIAGSAAEVFDAWLDPKVPGTPWNAADKLILDPRVGGLFFWRMRGVSHYGRFTKVQRATRVQYTWVSPNTLGQESTVTVSFRKRAGGTLLTLVHSRLPRHALARRHQDGWDYFLTVFKEQFGTGSRKAYRFREAHPKSPR